MTNSSMLQRWFGSNAAAQSGQPLELVRYDSAAKKFAVGEEALSVLRSVHAPMGVISVCGRARQGKSFILNQLLGQSSGFTVAPTHRPCTKGLWMWSAPQERQLPDGSKNYLVMLDTEGIDAWDQTGQYSVQIFSLAVLLSSLFVYNQMGGIDEAALDRLSLVTEMTKHIRVRANKGEAAESELSEFTPSFLWLLRDFYLQLEEDGRQVTPREYLETALGAVPETSSGAKAKNSIRESIKSLFPDRDCFALVRPISDEQKLAHLETVPPSQMRPEFRDGLAKLVSLCFSRAQPKRIGNTVLTGPMLAGLVCAYVDAINGGAVPTIATAWQGVAEAECRRAADAAEKKYHDVFDDRIQADEMALNAEHQRALSAAQSIFDEVAIGDDTIKAALENTWRAAVNRAFEHVRDKRLAQASQVVSSLISDMHVRLNERIADRNQAPADIIADLQSSLKSFGSTAEGPTKWPKMVEFLQSAMGVLVKRVEGDASAQHDASSRALAEAEAKLQMERAEVTKLRAAAGSEEARARALEGQVQAAHQKAGIELERLRTLMQEEQRMNDSKLAAELSAVRQDLSKAQADKSHTADSMQQAQAMQESLQRQLTQVTQQLQQEQARSIDLEAQVNKTQIAMQGRVSDLTAELESVKKRNEALITEKEGKDAMLKKLQEETEQHAAQLDHHTRNSYGEGSAYAQADMSTPDGQLTSACPDAEGMTIQEIKEWLIDHGFEAHVWDLANRRTPRVKKADWVALMKQSR
eukprot:jgi/Ulvmu1/10504/UM064_0042.1